MFTSHRFALHASCLALVLLLGAWSGAALADPPGRVARVGFLRGNVSFQIAGDDEWSEASLNRPLVTGDKVYTDRDSRIELEIGAADIRLDEGTSFSLLNLDDDNAQIELSEGTVDLHVRRMSDGQSYEIDTPTLAFVVRTPGDYRVDIAPQGDSTMVTVLEGSGDVYGENDASYAVNAGNSYKFYDSSLRDYEVLDLPRPDDFDEWCRSRDARYQRAASRSYVSEDVIGYADLDDYGRWSDVPEYGSVWYPTAVEAGWAPYRYGRWSWVDPWGWTWVDNAPWGFAPFHYGRWVYAGDRWGWCPGPRGARPLYAPAMVAFVGGAGWAVASGPVGWFPLGPRDVYVPWYRASRGYFTNINVYNTRVVDRAYITNVYADYSRGRPIRNVNYAYRNANAVTAVPRDAFVGARPVGGARVQVNDRELRGAAVVSRVGIAPERVSFAGAPRARAVPTAAAANRRVIARAAPPATVPLASRIQAIQRNGAQPLAPNQLRQFTPARTNASAPAASRVRVVGQNSTAKPPPLPARGAASAQRAGAFGAAGPRAAPTQNGPAANGAGLRGPTSAPGAAQRAQPAPAQNGRDVLPSSRFAPHAGGAPTSNAPATRDAPTLRSSPATPGRAPGVTAP